MRCEVGPNKGKTGLTDVVAVACVIISFCFSGEKEETERERALPREYL